MGKGPGGVVLVNFGLVPCSCPPWLGLAKKFGLEGSQGKKGLEGPGPISGLGRWFWELERPEPVNLEWKVKKFRVM